MLFSISNTMTWNNPRLKFHLLESCSWNSLMHKPSVGKFYGTYQMPGFSWSSSEADRLSSLPCEVCLQFLVCALWVEAFCAGNASARQSMWVYIQKSAVGSDSISPVQIILEHRSCLPSSPFPSEKYLQLCVSLLSSLFLSFLNMETFH